MVGNLEKELFSQITALKVEFLNIITEKFEKFYCSKSAHMNHTEHPSDLILTTSFRISVLILQYLIISTKKHTYTGTTEDQKKYFAEF